MKRDLLKSNWIRRTKTSDRFPTWLACLREYVGSFSSSQNPHKRQTAPIKNYEEAHFLRTMRGQRPVWTIWALISQNGSTFSQPTLPPRIKFWVKKTFLDPLDTSKENHNWIVKPETQKALADSDIPWRIIFSRVWRTLVLRARYEHHCFVFPTHIWSSRITSNGTNFK